MSRFPESQPYAAATTAPAVFRRVSWGAILAGAAVALVTGLILNLLGLAIGATAIEPARGDYGGEALGWGAAIWAILSAVVSLLAGGWAAGRLAGFPTPLESTLHGLVTFAVVALLTLYVATTTVGAVISGTSNLLGNTLAAAGNTAGTAAEVFAMPDAGGQQQQGSNQPGFLQQQASQWLERNGIDTTDPQAAQNITQAALDYATALATGGQADAQRQNLIDTVAQNTTLEAQEIEQKVDQFQREATGWFRETRQEVTQTATNAADTAADATAGASFGLFLALVLGGAAAALGGYLATPHGALASTVVETAGRREND